jgi:hypothetical protein
VKNHDFTPKNDIFSNCGGRREDCWGISCEKSRFYAKKIIFFPIAPPLDPPLYQLLAHGRWFSPGTPASSTTKTGRHDIAEILLKVTLTPKSNQIKSTMSNFHTLK